MLFIFIASVALLFSVLIMLYAVIKYYFIPNKIEIKFDALRIGDKILFMYNDTMTAGRITRHYKDIEVIYAKTLSKPTKHIRVEYHEILDTIR